MLIEKLRAGIELCIWALFVSGQAISVPQIDWLAVRAAIVWVRENPV